MPIYSDASNSPMDYEAFLCQIGRNELLESTPGGDEGGPSCIGTIAFIFLVNLVRPHR